MKAQREIDIFNFQDPVEYLREVFSKRKDTDSTFRLADFAKKSGINSPSLLSMVLSGKRTLGPSNAERFASTLSLTGKKKSYFLAMAQSQYAKTQAEKNQAREAMLLIRGRAQKKSLELKQYQFLATWFYSAIYILAGMRGTQWKPDWIANKLGRGVTAAEVRVAIDDLVSLGLLKKEGDGYVRTSQSLICNDDFRDIAARRYHSEMNRLAADCLSLPLHQRELNGLTVAIPKSLMPEVKERIRKFRKELDAFLSPFEIDADNVFQLNIQLFPLTASLDEKENA